MSRHSLVSPLSRLANRRGYLAASGVLWHPAQSGAINGESVGCRHQSGSLRKVNANEPPDDISEQLEGPVRPGRPAAIELAAALLIVGGVLGIVGVLTTGASQPAGLEARTVLTVVLNVAQIAVGAFIRGGRFWIVAVNFVAVLGFLDLTASGGSSLALMLGLSELAVFVILLVHRPWFDRRRWTQPPADLPFDAADREPTDDVLLEEEEHDRHGRREQD